MPPKFAFAVVAATANLALPGIATAASEADCAAQWTQADTNHDGVIAWIKERRLTRPDHGAE